jgi:hypothetical protein
MGMIHWAEEKIHNLTVWDFAVLKAALIIFGVLIGAYTSVFVKQYAWLFIAIFILKCCSKIVIFTMMLFNIKILHGFLVYCNRKYIISSQHIMDVKGNLHWKNSKYQVMVR